MVAAVREVVERVLGARGDDASYVACNHNHVRLESHGGETLLAHRKGAISAMAGERGLIPGSMGTRSYHVEGRGCADVRAERELVRVVRRLRPLLCFKGV